MATFGGRRKSLSPAANETQANEGYFGFEQPAVLVVSFGAHEEGPVKKTQP